MRTLGHVGGQGKGMVGYLFYLILLTNLTSYLFRPQYWANNAFSARNNIVYEIMQRMDGGGGEVRAEAKEQIIANERNERRKNQSRSCEGLVFRGQKQ